MAKLLLAAVFLPALIGASLQANYPLSAQIPPIARVDERFSFQFAPTTFQSDSDKLQYSLVAGPSWLSLDSKSRTLSGTPHANDAGEISITIAAAGSAGAVANMVSKLLVAKDTGTKAQVNITQVLSQAGQLSGLRTVSIGPSKPFNISFPSDAFTANSSSLSYIALLSDRTPLPAWISFDASSLHFAGTTPPTGSTTTFDIILIASDTPGYAASTLSFTVAVSNHQLLFQPFGQTLNLSKGDEVRITDLRSKLFLDGALIHQQQIQTISAKLPAWLKLDEDAAEISGTSPPGTMSQDLVVSAKDQYGDVAQFSVHLAFRSDLFVGEIGQLNATIGGSFSYVIPSETLAQKDEHLSVDFASLSKYLHFDPATSTISGKIEGDFSPQKVQCVLTASSGDGTTKDTQAFQILVTASPVSPSAGTGGSPDKNNSDGRTAGVIVGSIIGAICGSVLLATFAICLCRRKKNESYINPKPPRSPRKSDISRPIHMPWSPIMEQEEDLEKGKEDDELPEKCTPKHSPKLDMNPPADRKDSHSFTALTVAIEDGGTRIFDEFSESNFGIHNDIAPSQHPPDSMKIPTELAKRSSQKSDSFRKHKRRTTTVYQEQIHRSSGLPVNRRITGLGSVRHTYSPSRSNTNFSRSSMHRPVSSSSYTTTRCTSTYSTAPSAFPQPPVAQRRTAQVTTPIEARRSIRIVSASRRSSLADRRNWDEKRNSYIRKRASAQSPFFSAAGSRVSSSTYKSPPAFINEVQSSPRSALSPTNRNTIVRPDDDVVEGREKEIPIIAHLQASLASLTPETPTRQYPGSVRTTTRVARPFTSMGVNRDRVEKSYARPGTSIGPSTGGMRRRASTRDSSRVGELKSSLNNLTGDKIYKDEELSGSEYADEEKDIEEAENRDTIKPGQYTFPAPLNVDTRRRGKRSSGEKKEKEVERKSKRDSRRELKRTSERDPTPHYLRHHAEHGGKENASSTYNLDPSLNLSLKSSPTRPSPQPQSKARPLTTPERPKPSARHSRNASDLRKSQPLSNNSHPLPEAPKERHSRKSIHSRGASRQSSSKPPRSHSRSQSTAFPIFEFSSLDLRHESIGKAITLPASSTKPSLITRDLSGNLTFVDPDEEPESPELASRTANGRVVRPHSQRASQIPKPRVPEKSLKRPAVPFPKQSPTGVRPAGLGLFPVDVRAEMVKVGSASGAEKGAGDGDKNRDGNGDGLEVPRERQTWLKSVIGKSVRMVSGGSYCGGQGAEDKVFI